MKNSLLFFSALLLLGCQANQSEKELGPIVRNSLDLAADQYRMMHQQVPDTLFPRTTATPQGDSLITNQSSWWTSGFFPGSLWYLYEYTGYDEIKRMAQERSCSVEQEKHNSGDHDIGFKIYCSFGNGYRITGNEEYAEVMMTAAKTLTERYDEDVKAIRSWGDKDDQEPPYQVIVDNMMNLELLFWATRHSGDSVYAKIAINHADQTMEHHYREDGSSYHVVDFDPQTGEVINKRTHQGFADSSAWARGQSWGLYGYVMSYRETQKKRYLQQAREIAQFLLNHPRLPEDNIPYWDYDAPAQGGSELRDASAGAIMASALLELSDYVEGDEKAFYYNNAKKIIRSLSNDKYRSDRSENSHFLLKHNVGHLPGDSEVDVPLSYADYYYLESMMRYLRDQTEN